ncbi:glycosyltransferase family 2 protein [Sporofaciens musculi]|uniref:glycosyltransferase family 2 protein n=1 Tax=Sporofaciens musculi TaxID=2681861 RepID=UPI0025864C2A|nr:glycosyltransferase family 2 protein [Sporofaciens musculi]
MEEKKLSVIIPCFNGFRYMGRCLEAFESQTNHDFELLIVDDGSSDDTYGRLIDYQNKSDLQITVIRNDKNYGPGKSRRIAADYCKGKYVGFCDCDDWVDRAYVKEVVEELEKEAADLCMFNNYRVNDNKFTVDDVITKLAGAGSRREILAYAPMSLCRTVVLKALLNQVTFYDLYYGEDGMVLLQLLIKAKHPIFCKKPYYYYYMRESAAHARPSKRSFYDAVEGYSVLKLHMEAEYRDELVFTGIKNLIYAGTLQAFKAGISRREILASVEKFRKENPRYINNKYFASLNRIKAVYIRMVYYRCFLICRVMAYFHSYIMGK